MSHKVLPSIKQVAIKLQQQKTFKSYNKNIFKKIKTDAAADADAISARGQMHKSNYSYQCALSNGCTSHM